MEIREWSRMPKADKTVVNCMEFFTKAYKNRMAETLQGALVANATTTITANIGVHDPTPLLPGKWDYCWLHGLCQYSGAAWRIPAQHHKNEATLDNPMGGSAQIQFLGYWRPMYRQQKALGTSTNTTTTASCSTASQVTQVSNLMDK